MEVTILILDKLSNAKMYDHLHPRLKKGLHFLLENDLNAIEVGTYPIEDDKVTAIAIFNMSFKARKKWSIFLLESPRWLRLTKRKI